MASLDRRRQRTKELVSAEMTGPAFHEDWFPAGSIAALRRLARSVVAVPGRVIEIGSWEGRSTIELANAVHPRSVDAVDTWAGSAGEPSAVLAAERDVFAQFETNVAHWTRGNVDPWRMDWREWFDTVLCEAGFAGPVAFVFLDAEHSYEAVSAQLDAFLPILGSGAVICGDDWHHPPVRQALIEQVPDAAWEASVWYWQVP